MNDPPFFKGTVSQDFNFCFFHESVSPQPQSIPLGPFQIFSKMCEDVRKSRCTTGINDTGGKFATGINDTVGKFCHQFASVVDTGSKFATGVNDTGSKFVTGVNDTGGK